MLNTQMKNGPDKRLPYLPHDSTSENLALAMSRCFFEIYCIPEIRTFKRTLKLPQKLKSLFNKILRMHDQYIQHKINQLKKHGRQVTCTSGCGYCCQLMPSGISALEIIFIYDALSEGKLFSRIYRRFLERQEILEQIRTSYRERETKVYQDEDSAKEVLLMEYRQKGIPCPLLTDTNTCNLYSVRPFVCREYFSCSPRAWCNPAHLHYSQALRVALPLPPECQDMLDKIDDTFELCLPDAFSEAFLFFSTNITRFRPIKWI